jgi:glycine betaine/proline transport system substrate-binding protein
VWLPNHQQLLNAVQDDVVLLDPWFQGRTSFGIAVPSYVNIQSIPQLNQTDIREIYGIERDAVISQRVPDQVIPTYELEQEYVESSTAGMLADVEDRYSSGEDFAFIAWSPHWMNQRYNLRLLDDPEDALGDLNDPARMTTIVNEDQPWRRAALDRCCEPDTGVLGKGLVWKPSESRRTRRDSLLIRYCITAAAEGS